MTEKPDHIPPFRGAAPIFHCEWCDRDIYAPPAEHYRLVARGGCAAYQRHYVKAIIAGINRECPNDIDNKSEP